MFEELSNIKCISQCLEQIGVMVGFCLYYLLPPKNIIFIVSSMRSGSTLLKAVLAEGGDVSHLPEVDFQKFSNNLYNFYRQVYGLSQKRILVLKYPGVAMIPLTPVSERVKVIVLIRDTYEVVQSIIKRNKDTELRTKTKSEWVEYWAKTYRRILTSVNNSAFQKCFLRYEDLIQNPKEVTKKLFAFIGSSRIEGADHYSKPTDFEWEWGKDDGGEKIKKLQIFREVRERNDTELIKCIEQNELARDLRIKFGYTQNTKKDPKAAELAFI